MMHPPDANHTRNINACVSEFTYPIIKRYNYKQDQASKCLVTSTVEVLQEIWPLTSMPQV